MRALQRPPKKGDFMPSAPRVAIVDYDAGNLGSVRRACQEVGINGVITDDPDQIRSADKVIFPGVGSAESAVDTLHARGLFDALLDFYATGKPFLGICLGSQILLEHSEEGDKDCLGIVPGCCERFDYADRQYKVPHIGWNQIEIQRPHPLLKNVQEGDEFYFVHSYFNRPTEPHIVAMTEYGHRFCSVIAKGNLFATQFHLEKSGKKGLAILDAFRDWDGTESC
jgi:glutamine amidotransferase